MQQTYGNIEDQINPADVPKRARNVKLPKNPILRFFWRFSFWDWVLVGLGGTFFMLALTFLGLWYTNNGITAELGQLLALPRSTCPNDLNCLTTSARVLSSADTSQDYCDDFYKYSCNGFINRNFDANFVSGKFRFVDKLQKLRDNALLRILSRSQNAALLKSPEFKADATLEPVLTATQNYFTACKNVIGPAAQIGYLSTSTDAVRLAFQAIQNSTVKLISKKINDDLLNLLNPPNNDQKVTTAMVYLWQKNPNIVAETRGLDPAGQGIFPTGIFDVKILGRYDPNLKPVVVFVPPVFPMPKASYRDSTDVASYKQLIELIVKDYMYPNQNDVSFISLKVQEIFEFEKSLVDLNGTRPVSFNSAWQQKSFQDLDVVFDGTLSHPGSGHVYSYFAQIKVPISLRDAAINNPSNEAFKMYFGDQAYFSNLNSFAANTADYQDKVIQYSAYIAALQMAITSQLHGVPLPSIDFGLSTIFDPYATDSGTAYGLFETYNNRAGFGKYAHDVKEFVSQSAHIKADSMLNNGGVKLEAFSKVGYKVKKFTEGKSFVQPQKEHLIVDTVTDNVCLHDTVEKFSLGIALFYDILSMNSRDFFAINTIVTNVANSFVNRVKATSFNSAFKDQAVTKINKLNRIIGMPDNVLQPGFVEAFYEEGILASNKLDFFNNALNAIQSMNSAQLRLYQLDLPTMVMCLFQDFTAVDAFYVSNFNMIVLPFGMMQNEVFSYLNPKSINYGSLGFIVGHELSHAVDPNSNPSNEYGAPVASETTNDQIQIFLQKQEYFAGFMTKYIDLNTGATVNMRTAPQVIADNGGLKAAWDAYIRAEDQSPVVLPGLSGLSQAQLFYMGFAQLFCQAVDQSVELADSLDADNEYPIARFRVNGAINLVSNFATQYACSTKSRLNPVNDKTAQKCVLW